MKKKKTNGSENLAGNVSDDTAVLLDRVGWFVSCSTFTDRIVRRPEDLPDTAEGLYLAILPPEAGYTFPGEGEKRAEEILLGTRAKPRRYRNRVIFALPKAGVIERARECAREYSASRGQEGEKAASEALDRAVQEAYSVLLVPEMPDKKTCVFRQVFISARDRYRPFINSDFAGVGPFRSRIFRGRNHRRIRSRDINLSALEPYSSEAVLHYRFTHYTAQILRDKGALIYDWSPDELLSHLENYYFKEGSLDVSLARVWDDLCRHCYMKRLVDQSVLLKSARIGIERGLFGCLERYLEMIRGGRHRFTLSLDNHLIRKLHIWGYKAPGRRRKGL